MGLMLFCISCEKADFDLDNPDVKEFVKQIKSGSYDKAKKKNRSIIMQGTKPSTVLNKIYTQTLYNIKKMIHIKTNSYLTSIYKNQINTLRQWRIKSSYQRNNMTN